MIDVIITILAATSATLLTMVLAYAVGTWCSRIA